MELDKSTIRQMMKEKRSHFPDEAFFEQSDMIHQRILSHSVYLKSKMIGIYVNLPHEVETLSFIQNMLLTHRVCVPKVEGNNMHFYEIQSIDELQEGYFHVLEPLSTKKVDPRDIELMIIPLVAFDRYFYRVGYGKGFYDRYLSKGFHGYKLGIAFSFQEVDRINRDHFDQQLDEIITEKEVFVVRDNC